MSAPNRGVAHHVARIAWPLVPSVVAFHLPVLAWLVTMDGSGSPTPSVGECAILVFNSAVISGGAAAVATVIGAVLGVALEVYRAPGRVFLIPLILVPFFLPSVVMTTAVQALLAGGPLHWLTRGFPGAISMNAWAVTPLITWGVSRAVNSIPASERFAMEQSFGAHTVAWKLVVRRIAPTALRLGALSMLLTRLRLEIAEFAGVQTIPVRILGAFTALESDVEGWILVAITLLIVVPLAWLTLRALGRWIEAPQSPSGDRFRPTVRWPAVAVWLIVLIQLAPLVALLRVAFDAPIQAGEIELMTTTLASESLRGLVVALAVVWFGFSVAESGRLRSSTVLLLALPLLLPGSLIGLALVESVQHHLPIAVAETTLLLSIAQGVRFSAVGVLFGWLAVNSIPLAERHAAAWVEERPRRYRVYLVRCLPILSTGLLVVFALILGEVECAHLLSPAGYLPPVLALYQMLHFRFDEQAAQVSLSLILACSLVTLSLMRWGRGLR